MTTNFKAGDKVRISKAGEGRLQHVADMFGKTFTVHSLGTMIGSIRLTERDGGVGNWTAAYFALVKPYTFKAGDRVRVKAGSGERGFGDEGDLATVLEIRSGTDCGLRVNFDDPQGYGRTKTCYNRRFELAPSKVEAGRAYKTRSGAKVGPMEATVPGAYAPGYTFGARDPEGDYTAWTSEGRYFASGPAHKFDLVTEWSEPSAPAVPAAPPSPPTPAPASQFKKGDRVQKKDGTDWQGPPRIRVATVDRVEGTGAHAMVYSVETRTFILAYDLELAPEPAGSFIVANFKGGKLACAADPHIHVTREAAEKEALRLAELMRGQDFRVYSFGHLSTANAAPLVKPAAQLVSAGAL